MSIRSALLEMILGRAARQTVARTAETEAPAPLRRALAGRTLYHGSPDTELTSLRDPWLAEDENLARNYAGPNGRVYPVQIEGDTVPIQSVADSYFEREGAPSLREALAQLHARGFHDDADRAVRIYGDIPLQASGTGDARARSGPLEIYPGGRMLTLVRNPTERDMAALGRETDQLRYVTDVDGNDYVFNANNTVHDEMIGGLEARGISVAKMGRGGMLRRVNGRWEVRSEDGASWTPLQQRQPFATSQASPDASHARPVQASDGNDARKLAALLAAGGLGGGVTLQQALRERMGA